MLTLNDIATLSVQREWDRFSGYHHNSTLTLKDGRVYSALSSHELLLLISTLPTHQIQLEGIYNVDMMKEDLKPYRLSLPCNEQPKLDCVATVLNRIFPRQEPAKLDDVVTVLNRVLP